MSANYQRVIPRDLFNESKLLKCMGRLALLVLDGQTPCRIDIKNPGDPFEIEQDDCDGGLYIANYPVKVKGKHCLFKTNYNSKSNYPFVCEYDDTPYVVFDDDGNWDVEFLNFVNNL